MSDGRLTLPRPGARYDAQDEAQTRRLLEATVSTLSARLAALEAGVSSGYLPLAGGTMTDGTKFTPGSTYPGFTIQPVNTSSIINNGTLVLGDGGTDVLLFIHGDNNDLAIATLHGGWATHVHALDGNWSDHAGPVNSTNLYWNSGTNQYLLQNKTGGTRSYRVFKIGTVATP